MINTELIRQEIERQMSLWWEKLPDADKDTATWTQDEAKTLGEYMAYESLLDFIDSLQQEQPELDLEKFTEKIKTFQGRYKYPEIVSIKGAMAFMARMFYQYPNTARQWYEQLPKVTLD